MLRAVLHSAGLEEKGTDGFSPSVCILDKHTTTRQSQFSLTCWHSCQRPWEVFRAVLVCTNVNGRRESSESLSYGKCRYLSFSFNLKTKVKGVKELRGRKVTRINNFVGWDVPGDIIWTLKNVNFPWIRKCWWLWCDKTSRWSNIWCFKRLMLECGRSTELMESDDSSTSQIDLLSNLPTFGVLDTEYHY